MPASLPARSAADALALPRLLVARLTHDLGSPLGTLAGMLDMLGGTPGGEDAELLAVAREAGCQLRGRLRLQSAAWGLGAEPLEPEGLRELLAAAPAAQRVGFELAGPLFAATLPAALVPLVLNGALLAAEALPRGGLVRISGQAGNLAGDRPGWFLPGRESPAHLKPDPDRPGHGQADWGLAFEAEGRNAAWPAEVMAAFCGDREAALGAALAAGPRRVLAPLLLTLAAEQGFAAALALESGLPSLLLSRRG